MSDQTQPAPVADDMEKRTSQFIAVRDKIKELEAEHTAKLKPLRELQEILAGRIQTFMSTHGLENLKTSSGTCYVTTRTTASLADPQAFMDYVINSSAYDLLDRRANVTAVKAFVQKHKALPPGCNLNTMQTIGVRRAGGAASSDE